MRLNGWLTFCCTLLLDLSSLWKEVDGTYWYRARWYIIPEETSAGRQPHNLRRELYRTNDFADAEVIYSLFVIR